MLVSQFGCLVLARFAWRFVRPCCSQLAGRFADFVLCAPDHLIQRAMGFLGGSVLWGGHRDVAQLPRGQLEPRLSTGALPRVWAFLPVVGQHAQLTCATDRGSATCQKGSLYFQGH